MEIDRNRLRLDLENYFGTAQILMSSRQITICSKEQINVCSFMCLFLFKIPLERFLYLKRVIYH